MAKAPKLTAQLNAFPASRTSLALALHGAAGLPMMATPTNVAGAIKYFAAPTPMRDKSRKAAITRSGQFRQSRIIIVDKSADRSKSSEL